MTNWKSFLLAGALLAGVGAALLLAEGWYPIDIKPGSDPNCMDRDGKGVVSVALHQPGTGFIDRSHVKLSGAYDCKAATVTALRCKVEDVPGFGDSSDEVCHFSSADLRVAGVLPDTGTCRTVYLCLWTNSPSQGSGTLCDAKSSTCSQ